MVRGGVGGRHPISTAALPSYPPIYTYRYLKRGKDEEGPFSSKPVSHSFPLLYPPRGDSSQYKLQEGGGGGEGGEYKFRYGFDERNLF